MSTGFRQQDWHNNKERKKERKMKRKIIMLVAIMVIAVSSYAQTTANSGYGVAGNGVTGTSPRYNIDGEQVQRFDGDRNGPFYIVCNGRRWPVYAPQASSPYCSVIYYDAVQGHYVQYGTVAIRNSDSTKFLAGTIIINRKTMRVINFKAIAFYTPSQMPTIQTRDEIGVRIWSSITNTFVPAPWLTVHTPLVSGMIWLNGDHSINSAVLDGSGNVGLIIVPNQGPIPPPGGLGGPSPEPLMPAWLL